jgi:hypothetical protein
MGFAIVQTQQADIVAEIRHVTKLEDEKMAYIHGSGGRPGRKPGEKMVR